MEGETSTPETGTTQDFVPIPDASDADLEAFLESEKAPESETEEPEQKADSDSELESETETPEETPEQEVKLTAAQHKALLAELEQTKEQLQKKEQRNNQQEQFIQRRNGELGELRKQLLALKEEKASGLQAKHDENPVEATKDILAIGEIDKALKDIDTEASHLNRVQRNGELLSRYVKPDEVPFDAVKQSLIDDGLAPEFIAQFESNPLGSVADGETLIHLYKRAKAENAIRTVLLPAIKSLQEENKKLKSKSKSTFDNVAKALRNTPSVTAASGVSASRKDAGMKNPAKMTDAELNEFLKEAR